MGSVDGQSGAAGGSPSSEPADLKLEVVVIPVADAERSKAFYAGLGWRLDADFSSDKYEKRIDGADSDWPDRYAEDTVREQNGRELPL